MAIFNCEVLNTCIAWKLWTICENAKTGECTLWLDRSGKKKEEEKTQQLTLSDFGKRKRI